MNTSWDAVMAVDHAWVILVAVLVGVLAPLMYVLAMDLLDGWRERRGGSGLFGRRSRA